MKKTDGTEKFAFRRDNWMRQLMESDLPSGAKVVGARLALYMNEEKQFAYPSYKQLGKDCNLSARQAQTHVLRLERGNENDLTRWITVKHTRNTGNTYWLRYWWEE